ncbi:MAG: phosphatidate cytidylyltransferase [Clostridiales bacterium]|nr:phosphatidate cytidylyltransferase [Clostridiales bacterium]
MLKTRIISVIVTLPFMIASLCIGGMPLTILILLITFVGLYEYYNAFKNIGHKPNLLIGYLGTISYHIAILFNRSYILMFPILLFIVMLLLFLDVVKKDKSILDISITMLGLVHITFMFSMILFLHKGLYGRAMVWLPFLTAWLSDTFAYFSGVYFGKNKLCPKISPKKTVEGSLGGIFGSTVFSIIAGILFKKIGIDIPLYHYGIIGVLSGITGQIGDLFASSIKRFCKVKDFGSILPGHGGILDRFDSILFTAPTVYFYVKLFL